MIPTYKNFRIGAVETGARGEPGKSAYELWLENGNKGTIEEFLNSLRGRDGKQGRPGRQGEKGEKGEDGNILQTELINSVDNKIPFIIINSENDFNPNDISSTINRLISVHDSGVTLFLKDGEYHLRNKIMFNKRLNLILNGTIKCHDLDICISVEDNPGAYQLNTKQLYVHNMIGVNSNICLEILNCYNAIFNIGYIKNFNKNCIKLEPNKTETGYNQGIQYCKINFNLLTNNSKSNEPIILLKGGDNCKPWINENKIVGGRLIGSYGVKTVKGQNQTDRFNNNKFDSIGFEGIENDAITMNFTINNSLTNFRFENVKGYYIKDDNSSYNQYDMTQLINNNKISITSNNTLLNIPLTDDGGSVISNTKMFNIYGTKEQQVSVSNGIVEKNSTGVYVCESQKKLFERYCLILVDENNNKMNIPCRECNTKLVENTDYTMEYLFRELRVVSNNNNVTITIPDIFMYDGANFVVSTNYNTNPIKFVDESGLEHFTINNSDGLGTWSVIFVKNRGRFTHLKISDGFRLF